MRERRLARGVLGVLLGLVALVALVIGGTLTFLRTERGGSWLLSTLVPRINQQIAGHLTVTSLRLEGWRVALGGVTLRAPDGEVVAQAAKVEVAAVPLALVRNRLILDSVLIDGPTLRLVVDAKGLNLQRAIASRLPLRPAAAPKTPREPSRMSMSLGSLAVRGGLVDFRARLPHDRRHVRIEDIVLDGKADYRSPDRTLSADMRGTARAEMPFPAPIALDVRARGEGERGEAKISIDVGDSAIHLSLAAAGRTSLDLNVDRIAIDPRLVRAVVPDAPGPAAPVQLTGHVRRAGPTVTANLALTAGRGRILLEGSGDPDRSVLRGLRVTGKSVDFAALLNEGPRSAVDFALDAHGSGRDLQSLRGEVRLDVPPSRLGPGRAGPVRLHARADDDGYKLIDLLASLPGLSLRGHGNATRSALNLEATLVARDLQATVRALEGPGPKRLPAVAGNGALRVEVTGPAKAPRLEVRGGFPTLRFEANRADGLEVVLDIADLRRPQLADLRVRALRLKAGDRSLRDVRLALASERPRTFTASASVAAPALSLRTTGRWSAHFQAMTIEELRLVYPEAQWQLMRPVRLSFVDGFALEDLALASGSQRIAASLQTTPRRVAGKVAITKLDVGRLPRALLPASLNLAGVVDLDAEVAGTTTRPRGRARLSIENGRFARENGRFARENGRFARENGRFQQVEGLAVKLDALHDGHRVAGTMAGRSSKASLSARFDLPAVWPPPDRAPLALELTVAPFDIPALLASVGVRPSSALRGQAALEARVDGTFAHPHATVDAQVQRLVVRGERLGDATIALSVATPPTGVDAKVQLRAFGGAAWLRARAPLTVARVTRLSRQALLRLPVTMTGAADELPLRPFARLANSDEITGGTLTMRLDGRGSAQAPAGEVTMRLDDVAGRRFPATDASVDLSAHQKNGPRVVARVGRKGQTLATLDASVALATARLTNLNALASAPLAVRAHLGPLRIKRGDLPPATERDEARAISAVIEANLRLDGTLRAPRLALSTSAQDARLDDRHLGRAEVVLRYQNARPALSLNLLSANGGAFRLTGSAAVDLGYPRVLRPINTRTIPLVADLESRDFDLGALSGLVEAVRTVGGTLTANARLRGMMGAPQVDGRIEWKEGRLVVADLGGYEKIHLLVHGNGQQVVLEDLSAHAGQGRAKVTGRAVRAGAEGFRVTTSAQLRKFPLYAQGQPVAALSLDARTSGSASAEQVNLSTKVSEAHVALAEGKRKKLQALDRPADVVLLDHGKPLNRDQARKLQRLVAARQAEAIRLPATKQADPSPRRIRIAVEAPRNLWIEGPDIHLEVGLDEGFIVNVTDEARVFGTVLVKRGRLELLGRRFDVDGASSVRFTGPPDRPTLAIKATHQARKAGIAVRVALEGPLDKLDLRLSSPDNPQLGDTELLAVLATGQLPDEKSGGAATPGAQAVSVVGGVLASQVQKSLSKRLPLDVLVIEPGEGLSGTRLEAGTYLTDALYVAYVGRVGADPFGRENRNELQLEYQLSKRWSFEGTYGDARRGSADLVWTKNY